MDELYNKESKPSSVEKYLLMSEDEKDKEHERAIKRLSKLREKLIRYEYNDKE